MEAATIPSAHHKLCSVGLPDLAAQALLARMALPSRVVPLAPSALSLRQAAHVVEVGPVVLPLVRGALADLVEDWVVIKHAQSIETEFNQSTHLLFTYRPCTSLLLCK